MSHTHLYTGALGKQHNKSNECFHLYDYTDDTDTASQLQENAQTCQHAERNMFQLKQTIKYNIGSPLWPAVKTQICSTATSQSLGCRHKTASCTADLHAISSVLPASSQADASYNLHLPPPSVTLLPQHNNNHRKKKKKIPSTVSNATAWLSLYVIHFYMNTCRAPCFEMSPSQRRRCSPSQRQQCSPSQRQQCRAVLCFQAGPLRSSHTRF